MPDADTRPRVPLTKPIDLAQLAAEVGTALSASESEVVVADHGSAVTTAELEAAVRAHQPATEADPAVEFETAVKAATTLDALKAALLGIKGPGAEPRRS